MLNLLFVMAYAKFSGVAPNSRQPPPPPPPSTHTCQGCNQSVLFRGANNFGKGVWERGLVSRKINVAFSKIYFMPIAHKSLNLLCTASIIFIKALAPPSP